MPTTAVIILTALVTAVGGYLLNQLPEVRQFKGRNWLIIRLFLWITLLPVAYELLTNEQVLSRVKTLAKFSVTPLVLLLILDLWKLVTVIWGRANTDAAPQDLRTRLLKAVQTEVAGRLEDSLHQQMVINLLMQQQLSQVNRSDQQKRISLEEIEKKQAESNFILRLGHYLKRNGASTELDPQESIFETFKRKDVGEKLLLLGAPGSGKTTTLLKLAEALVEEALQDGQQRIPVIFELSTWKDDKQSIHDWLIEQLKLNYNIDPKTGAQWLKSTHLLPLLDGLDELGLKRQALCVERINEFVKGLPYPHAVVCCRSEEYAEGRVWLGALRGAVCLEPLRDEQIRRYFCEQLEQPEIWQAIQQQSGLKALLEPSVNRDVGILRIPLFLTILSVAYEQETLIESDRHLFDAYIHRRLRLNTRKAEREQFRRDWAYKAVDKEPDEEECRRYLIWMARKLNSENLVELLIERMQPRWLATRLQKSVYRLIVCLIGGLIFSLIFGVIFGLMGGLVFGLIGILTGNPDNNISPVESFKFSMPTEVLQEIGDGLIVGLIVSLAVSLVVGLIEGALGGLIFGVIGTLIFSLKADFQIREKPNQGMWAAAFNIPLISIISYPGALVVFYLPDWALNRNPSIVASSIEAIKLALWFGISLGGGSVLAQHLTLRSILTFADKTPWNYARFLNYCAERRLLQRIGGRYRFIHRELLDHFAEM